MGLANTSRVPAMGGSTPFLWCAYDGLFDHRLLQAAGDDFPTADSDAWIRYQSPGEKKLALNAAIPPACASLLGAMNRLCPSALVADPTFYAGGLHCMPGTGGVLDLHEDCDRHPMTGYLRSLNAILFLDDWEADWGGALELWPSDLSECGASILPAAGRLVVFECGDGCIHGIPTPIEAPINRRSLAAYWWKPERGACKRPRAKFVGLPGEQDESKEQWRRRRAGL